MKTLVYNASLVLKDRIRHMGYMDTTTNPRPQLPHQNNM